METLQGFFTALPYFIVLIGLLVFVHEAGHFAFAKLFKVKVHVFSLGFGPKLVGYQRGETLYKVCLVPVGGYVKMLGEDPTEAVEAADRGRAFGDKPPWQRLTIIVGGPLMNVLFPLVLHFGVGLSFTDVVPPELGLVLPGMPAWEAGLRSGDVVESIDGDKVGSFDDLIAMVTPRPGEKLAVVVRRGSERLERTVFAKPTVVPYILDEKETVGRIGVSPGYLPPLVGIADPASPAARAGLEAFDLVVAVGQKPIARLVDLEREVASLSGSDARLRVRRLKPDAAPPFTPFADQLSPEEREIVLPVPAGVRTLADLGIESSADYVAHVTPGGPAAAAGLARGDRLLALDGESFPLGQIFQAIDQSPATAHTLAWSHAGVRRQAPFKPKFVPAGEAADLGVKRDAYDKGFWGLLGQPVLPAKVANPALVKSALDYAASETWAGVRLIGVGFKLLFSGDVSLRSIGGPIMIGQLAGQAGEQGALPFFWIMALISLNLGLLNLLPIPVLDGGQIVIIGIEALTRRPINRAVKEWVMIAGVAMLFLLMIFATWNDIARILVG